MIINNFFGNYPLKTKVLGATSMIFSLLAFACSIYLTIKKQNDGFARSNNAVRKFLFSLIYLVFVMIIFL